ncbi:MAG TPA: hypothetical protein VIW29_08425 [Polyangiaceae bacterium]
MRVRLAACVVATLVTCVSVASADPMDPALERLVLDPSCHKSAAGDWNDAAPPASSRACKPDHVAFKRLMNQYGFALAPNAMHSARTTGYGGFHLSIEADYTKISSDAEYWKRGTQGPVNPSDNSSSTENATPQDLLQLYSLKFRKSFGFGLELTGTVGFMPKTSILSGGADVRVSLLEGFRTGLGGVLPDIAVGGGVRTITGTPQFQMTVVGLDVQISKPLPIQDSSILTPYVGYQYLWIFADSGLIDLTPSTDAIRYCNYKGQDVPGNTDPNAATGSGNEPNDGQPVCNGGSPLDFNNNAVFQNVRLERHRLIFGLNYRYEMVMLGGQFLIDAVPPSDAQTDGVDEAALMDEDRQYTLSFELGAMF